MCRSVGWLTAFLFYVWAQSAGILGHGDTSGEKGACLVMAVHWFMS